MFAERALRIVDRLVIALAVACVGLMRPASVLADCGSIPFRVPKFEPEYAFGKFVDGLLTGSAISDEVKLNPLDVVVYEPGQRAIILWNGSEEILLLSTEIKTSQNVSILEVIPLPAEPEVRLGDFESFTKMEALLLDKQMWRVAAEGGVASVDAAATITFHEKMGAHDVAVVNVLDKEHFVDWVMQFLASKKAVNPQIRPEFVQIIEKYLDRGFNWFVFDTIEAEDKLQSRQPIEYRFKSDRVFYPLEISSLETGRTTVNLTVVTESELISYPRIRFASKEDTGLRLTAAEVSSVAPAWTGFMRASSCAVQRLRIRGNIRKLKTDFVAR